MTVYDEVRDFYESYRGEKLIFGESEEGRSLFALFSGDHSGPVGISQYAIHGREWITALLALCHLKRGTERGGVWILPLTNPDGALLSETGLASFSGPAARELLAVNGSDDFSLWKANARAVDLNVNFPAGWGTGKSNRFAPAPENFVGNAPLCAAESRALADFTLRVRPDFSVSWHTKGEELYWRFRQPPARAARDFRYARVLSEATGCPLKEAKGSAGGYKDWCVETLHIPAFTVEIGSDGLSHPIGRERLPELNARYKDALADFLREI